MDTSPTIRVERHPGIPSPTALQVLRSGVRGFDVDEGLITAISFFECFEGAPRGGKSLGKGWYFACEDGDVFLPDPGQQMFKPFKQQVLGFWMDYATAAFDWIQFDEHADELVERAVVMPNVDLIQETGYTAKTLWMESTYRVVELRHQNGNTRSYTIKAGKEWFGPPSMFVASAYDRRWSKEFEVMSAQVIHEALGGDQYLEGLKQRLREKGLRVMPVEQTLTFETFSRRELYTPRLLDGPADTQDFIEDDVSNRLEDLGFAEGLALGTLYLYENPGSVSIRGMSFRSASKEALKDVKFASALLERWRPSLDSWRAAFAPFVGTNLEFHGPDDIERCARGDWPYE